MKSKSSHLSTELPWYTEPKASTALALATAGLAAVLAAALMTAAVQLVITAQLATAKAFFSHLYINFPIFSIYSPSLDGVRGGTKAESSVLTCIYTFGSQWLPAQQSKYKNRKPMHHAVNHSRTETQTHLLEMYLTLPSNFSYVKWK